MDPLLMIMFDENEDIPNQTRKNEWVSSVEEVKKNQETIENILNKETMIEKEKNKKEFLQKYKDFYSKLEEFYEVYIEDTQIPKQYSKSDWMQLCDSTKLTEYYYDNTMKQNDSYKIIDTILGKPQLNSEQEEIQIQQINSQKKKEEILNNFK